jgi:hypothetical protein
MHDYPSDQDLPWWAIGLIIVIAVINHSRPKGERVVYASHPTDWLLGFVIVMFLHVVDLLPSPSHNHQEAFGNLLRLIWWVVWNILLIGALAFFVGWTFSKVPRGTAWSIRIALWVMPLLYIGAHYLLHRS